MLAPELLPIWGGVGTYVVELIRHLPKTVEVEVVTPYRKRLGYIAARTSDYNLEEYFPSNVHIHFVSSAFDTFFYNAAFQYACLRRVPKLVKDEHVDLIHSHTAHMPDILLMLRRLSLLTVTTVHTTIAGQRRGTQHSGMSFSQLEFSEKATLLGYPFLRIAERFFFSRHSEYITVSNWMKERIGLYFPRLDQTKIRVIYNSVDTKFFTPGSGEEPENILFTGRIVAQKGVTFLLDAIPKVISRHPDAVFTFIGPGNFQPYMNRLLALNVPNRNTRFLGYVKDHDAILGYYRRCTLYLVPTLYENLPLRALEAMACGKAVIATNVSAIPEAITSGQNGLLVPPRSSEALAGAINYLLDRPNVRAQIGREARKTTERKFDSNVNAKKVAEAYEEILQSR
jgi:glycosyltransferase involved in cell wall biosynthesis